MIGLSVDESIDLPAAFLKKKPSSCRQGYVGGEERCTRIRETYGIRGIPSIRLIGPDGRFVARDLRGAELRKAEGRR